jgi:hypothetical protein
VSKKDGDAQTSGTNELSGTVVGSMVQMGRDVGDMMIIAGQAPADALTQARAALRDLRSALAATSGEQAEQARAAAAIIERELTATKPKHSRLRAAYTKLGDIALSIGVIAGAVNSLGAALDRLGLR